jgi:hypothetical protein
MTMPFQIRTPDGRILNVSTHVGNGLSVVEIWEEEQPADPQPLDQQGENE